MRRFTTQVFDETISGTTSTWYTSASHNDQLGGADDLIVHAVATDVSGSNPTVTCQLEHSGNGRHWNNVSSTPEINAGDAEDESLIGFSDLTPTKLGRVRIRISLGGDSPSCRLKIFVTGRAQVVAAQNGAGGSRQSGRGRTGPPRAR